jgi:UDPglucose 6-dehydrogenase
MKILITGSGGGIGNFLARHLGTVGHEIWGVGRSPQAEFQRECSQQGISFRCSQADISDWNQISALCNQVAAEWTHLDALICCAGIQGPLGAAVTLDPVAWSRSLRINLDGTFYTIRAFYRLLCRHQTARAKILCLSGGGSASPRVNFAPYASAKAAVVRLVENLSKEWAQESIDINAIAPGAINTRMTQEVLNLGPAVVGEREFKAATEQIRRVSPLPRVAAMVDLLLSSESDGISGRLISTPWDPWERLPLLKAELAQTDIFTLRRIVAEDRGKQWSQPSESLPTIAASSLRLAVVGLWHLGSVTAACCARHFQVNGLDFDAATVATMNQSRAPVFEPGLDELLRTGLDAEHLRFTTDAKSACVNADVLWLCYDTPVNDHDEPDVAFVVERLRRCLPHLPVGALVLISSQLPVGTCRTLEVEFPQFHFACSPENLRLGRALDAFEKAERVIVGIRTETKRVLLEQIFKPFTSQVLFMRTESAEMVKHALNSFLALSVTFINEIARLCEHVGADAKEVSAGLKSDARIGPKAYVNPGSAFAGGTLARDVVTLTKLAAERRETAFILPAIKCSNDEHREWAFRKLKSRLGDLHGKTVAVLGLVYTPNTDTLRRSAAIELCQRLVTAGASVRAFDPAVKSLPSEFSFITLASELSAALHSADAAIVCTEWPAFREARWTELARTMRQRVFVDANRFLEAQLCAIADIEHISVGRVAK